MATRLPWEKKFIDGDSLVSFVRCTICSKVEGRKKLLIPKLDYLLKHLGRRKTTFAMPKVKVGEFYENKKCAYAKKQVLFAQILVNFVLQLVIYQGLASNKRKFVQFIVILYVLFHSKPMNFFENMKSLLELLKVKHCLKKH